MTANEKALIGLPYRRGVGAVLFNDDGLVWIGRRISKPKQDVQNYWQMPQGGIDDEEDPAAAVLRELREETGTDQANIIGETANWLTYDLPAHLQKKVWNGQFQGQRQKWFALQFSGLDTDFDLRGHQHPEFDAWRWAQLETLPDLIVPFKREIYESVVDAFAKFAVKVQSRL